MSRSWAREAFGWSVVGGFLVLELVLFSRWGEPALVGAGVFLSPAVVLLLRWWRYRDEPVVLLRWVALGWLAQGTAWMLGGWTATILLAGVWLFAWYFAMKSLAAAGAGDWDRWRWPARWSWPGEGSRELLALASRMLLVTASLHLLVAVPAIEREMPWWYLP